MSPLYCDLKKKASSRRAYLAWITVYCFCVHSLIAASLYWDTNDVTSGSSILGSGTWGVDNFWNSDGTGGAGGAFQTATLLTDDLIFSAGSSGTGTGLITISGAQSAQSLVFNNGTISLLGTASPSLTLAAGGLTMNNTLDGALTIAASLGNVILSNTQTWANHSSRALTVSAKVSGSAGGGATHTLTVGGSGSGNVTIGGVLEDGAGGGALAVSKSGSFVLSVSGANTYTGATFVTDGTLRAGVLTSAFGVTSAVTLSNAAGVVLDLAGFNNLIGSLAGGGASGGNVVLGAGTLSVGSDGTSTTYAGIISGAGGVIKKGAGTLTLTGANGYTGLTAVNAGVLRAGVVTSAFGVSSPVTLSNVAGARLDLNGFDNTIGSLAGGGVLGGDVSLGSAILTVGGDGTGTNYAGILSGAGGGLTKVGAGTLRVTGVNTYTGNTTVSAGVFQVGDGVTDGSIAASGAIVNNAAFVVNVIGAQDYAMGISGGGTLSKLGAGTLSLSGNNTYTGLTTISSGTLSLGSANALNGGGNITFAGGTLQHTGSNVQDYGARIVNGGSVIAVDTNGNDVLYSGAIGATNTAGVTKFGSGILTFGGANGYTGTTTINGGTLQAGVSTSAFGNGGTVTLGNVAGVLLDLNGFDNTIGSLAGGGTTGGSVALGSAILTVGGNGANATFSGVLSGAGGVTKLGAGTQTLTGASTYTGVTTVSAGSLQLGDGTTDGSVLSSSGIVNNASLVFNLIGNQTDSFAISGTGTLLKKGAGILTFSGNNTYSGTTVLSAGTLNLGGVNALGGGGAIGFSGGTLQFSAANTTDYATRIASSASRIALDTNGQDVTFSGVIPASNTGGLSKVGAGTLTLAGVNLYTGATNIIGGTLQAGVLTSSFASNSAMTLSNAAGVVLDIAGFNTTIGSLAGGGATGGNVVLGSSTLSLGGDGTSTTFSGIISGAGGLIKGGAGVQTLSGANSFTGATTVTAGSLKAGVITSAFGSNVAITLSNVAGVALDITGFSNTIGSLAGGGATGGNLILGAAILTLGGDGTSTTFAGGVSGTGGGITKTGAGTLTFSKANTYTGATSVSAGSLIAGVLTSSFGSNSAVTLSNVANVILDISGFNTTIGSLAGGGTTGGTVTMGASTLSLGGNGTSTTFSGILNGSGGITKSGAGTQTFSGSNTYTGATAISAGSLKAGMITSAFGINSAISLSNVAGVFLDITGFNNTIGSLAGGGATGGNVILGAATLTLGGDGTSTTYAGGISGTGGGFVKTGTGTLTLSKANTYTGATVVNAGTLKAGVITNAFGNNSAVTLADTSGVILDITGFNNAIGSLAGGGATGGSVTLGAATLTVGGDGTSTTFSGMIGGAGGITKSGAGVQTFSGTNTYTGATSVSVGSLKAGVITNAFGNNSAVTLTNAASVLLDLNGFDTTIGSLAGGGTTGGSVALGAATLTVGADATNTAFAGVITGAGGIIKTGAGALTFTGAETYTGLTTISAGTLQLGNGTTNGSLTGSSGILNNGSLIVNLLGTQTNALSISGTGRLAKAGTGTLVLSGSNSYTGITTVGSGVLNVGGVNALAGGGTLTFGGGTLQFSAGNTVDYSARILNSTSAIAVDTNSQSVDFTSALAASNTGGLTKYGAGILTVSGANVYSGTTTVLAGTLRAGSGSNAFGTNAMLTLSNVAGVQIDLNGYDNTVGSLAGGGSLGGNVITGGGTLTAGGAGTSTTYAGSIMGAGGLTKEGAGTFTLTGTGSYTGVTLINAGTLQVGDGTADGSILSTSGITNNAALTFNLIGSQTDALNISGTGILTKSGVGILTLSGSNSVSGLTIIGSGTLSLGSANALAGGGGVSFRGGTLQFGASNTVDYSSRIVSSTSAVAIDTNGQDLLFAGALVSSNTSGLSKFGSGTLTLAGANVYTGATTVVNGTLKAGVASSAFGNSSAVTLANNANALLDLAGLDNSIGSLAGGGATGGNVSLGSGTLTLGGDGTSTTFSGVISGSGGISKSGAGIQTLSRANTYTGATRITAGSLKAGVAATAFGVNSAVTLSNVAGAVLDITGFSNAIGSLSGGGTTGGNVILGSATLTLGADGTSTTFTGVVSGAGALTKSGTGTQTFSGANTYTGATSVVAGTLKAGVATSAFGSNSAVSLSDVSGVVLDITGFNTAIGSLAGGGSTGGNVSLGLATLTLGGDGTSTTFSGVLSGSGGVSKSGAGTQTFSGVNTYTGATSVAAGTLKAGVVASSFGSNSAVSLSNVAGVILDITGFNTTIGSLSGGGATGGKVTLGSATLTLGADGISPTFTGVLSGSGSVSKSGTGTQTFSGANTYTGATSVVAGTLKAGIATSAFGSNSAVSLGNTAGVILDITGFDNTIGSLSGGGSTGGNVSLGSATLTLGGDGTSTTFAGVVSGSGGITKSGAGTQTFSGTNTYTGTTSVTAGTLKAGIATSAFGSNSAVSLSNVAGVVLDITGFNNTIGSLSGGGATGGSVTLGLATLSIGGDGTSTTFAGMLSGVGGVIKSGTGTLTLSGANTYTGATTVSAGTLKAGVATTAFGVNSALTLGNTSGATLDITGFNSTVGSLSGGGTTGGSITLGSAVLSFGGDGSDATFAGSISGSGGLSKSGAGTQILSGVSTYSGTTSVTAGTLKAGVAVAAFGGSSAVTLSNVAGATLDITGFSNTIGSLAGGGAAGGGVTLGSATLTVGGDSTSTTYSGVLSGAGGLVKTGAGTLTLSGTNLYTGTTVVNGGSLVAGGAGAFAGLGGLTVNSGALDLSGQSLSIGSLSQNGGSLSLGAGNLVTVAGSASLGGTVNVGGTVDTVNVGRYTLLSVGGILGGSLTTGSLPDSTVYYLNTRGVALDLQRKATIGTVTASTAEASIITGGSTALTVTVLNGGPTLSDALSVTLASAGSLSGSGTASGVAPQASSGAISGLLFTGTSIGALQTGTVRVSGASSSNASVDASVSVNVYDHATTSFTGGTLILGSLREGYSSAVAGSNSLSVLNAAGYRVSLMGSATGAGGISLSSMSGITAGSSGLITASLVTGSLAGSLSRSFTYTFADDSSLSGALASVGTATIQVTGGVYRSAVGSLERSGVVVVDGGTLSLAAVRLGDTFAPLALDVRNTATSGDVYSEKLNAAISSGTGSGSVSLLSAGSLQSGPLSVSVASGLTGSVGVKTGSVVIGFQTDGTGTSGLAANSTGSGTVNLTGTVYRKAEGTLGSGTVNLGAVRESGSFTGQSITVSNTASGDGFSDDLVAAISTVGSGFTVSGTTGAITAGSQNSSSLQVNYTGSTASAGAISGTAAISYTSRGQSGTGLSDVASTVASGTVAVSGSIYRLASGSLTSGTLSLGNIRTGSAFGSGIATLTNTAANDGYSDLLRVEQASSGNGFVVLGGSQTLTALQAGTFSIGLVSSPTAIGVTSGSVTFGLTSVGQSGTGLGEVTLTAQTLNVVVTGSVYRAGSGVLGSSSLTLASIREADSFVSSAASLTNGAATDGFSEKLNASFGTLTGSAISSGSVQLLAAGSSDVTTLQVGLSNNGSAGLKSGSVRVLFETDGNGTSGVAGESVGSGTVAVTGAVYRKAVGVVGSGTLGLAAIREAGSFTAKTLSVSNSSSADGFSDDLAVAISLTGTGMVGTGSVTRLSGGTLDSSSLQVNHTGSTASAGAVSGTATLAYTSKGQTGTGLADVAPVIPSETVAVSGAIYRLAQGGLSGGTLTFGNIRIGSAFSAGTLTVTNTAANDTFSDLLRVSEAGNAGGFTILGGTQTLGAAQTGTFSIGLTASPTAIGTTGGTVSFGLTSVGQTGLGLSDVSLGSQTLNVLVTGTVYRMGSGVLSASQVTLASVREGEVFVAQGLGLTNGAANDGFSEKLNATFGTLSGSALGSGSVQLLAAGSSNLASLQVGLTNSGTAGVKSGAVVVQYETDGNGTSGLAGEATGSGTVSVSGSVYRKAAGGVSSGTLVLAAIREGEAFAAKTVSVSNTSSTDGYSDDLAAAISVVGTGMVASGSAGLISAGSQNNTAMQVNYTGSTATAGLIGGTATLAYVSKGQSGTGLSDVAPATPTETVAVSATIYRLAQGSLSTGTLSLGNVRTGSSFGSSSVVVTNTAANDGYSDLLRVGQTGNVSGFTILGGTQTLAAAGTGSFSIGFSAAASAAGITSGTLSFGLTSVGQAGTGLSDVALANQTVVVTGTVYRAGSGVLASNQVVLAGIREADVFTAKTVGISNGAAADGFSEKLNVALGSVSGGAVASGSIQLLAAGSANTTALQTNLTNNGTAGLKTGTVNLLYTTDGSGTSGLAVESVGSGTVTVSGSVYRKAVGALSSSLLDLGAIRENGAFTAKSLTVQNVAGGDGFSDDLEAVAGTGSSGITVSGSAGRITAGSSNATDVLVNYTGGTGAAGVVSGTAGVLYTSKGQVGTGLSDVAPVLATGATTVNGTIYRLAQGSLGSATLSLGNIRAGSVFGSGTVQVTNTAANDGFSDLLRVTQAGDTGGFVAFGGTQTLAASNGGTFSVGLRASPTAVGTTSGSVIFGLTSVGQTGTGLSDVDLPSQTLTVSVTGSVYRAGSGVLSSSALTMESIREGDAFSSKSLLVTNGAEVDGFSEKLNASFGSLTGGALAGGSLQLLAAGGTNSTSLQVGLNNSGTAGLKQGTVRVLFETDGNGTSGIAAESVGTGTVALSGSVYRKAIGLLSSGTLELAAIRENGAFAAKAVTVANEAGRDGYSDDLGVTLSSSSAGVSVSGGIGRVSAGTQNSTDLLVNYTGNTASAGVLSGTAAVSYTSKGQVGTGLADVAPDKSTDVVAVSGTVYRTAQGTLSLSTLDLGRVHAGQVASLASITVGNVASNDGYSDLLKVAPSEDSSGFVLGGSSQMLAANGTAAFGVGYNFAANVSGLRTGTLSFGMTSVGQSGTGLADLAQASGTVNVSAQVYTGMGIWSGADQGSWQDLGSWSSAGGRPGLDGVLSRGVDSATFTAVNPMLVRMPEQLVELARLEFLGSGGVQLTTSLSGGGAISLSGEAQIQASGGNHFVEVPLTLAQTATITVGSGAKLTLGGVLSGAGGFRKSGNGTLLLSAANTYRGATTVDTGRLEIGVGGLPGTGAITLAQGAVLAFNLTADLIIPNTILGAGSVVSLNAPYRVFWSGGSTAPFGTGQLRIGRGETFDFSADMLSAGQILDINAGTLRVKQTPPQVVRNLVTMETSADFSIQSGSVLTLTGNVSGNGVLRKSAAGKLVLEGTNTYYGGTEVLAGTLEVAGTQALGTAGVRIDAPGQLQVNVASDSGVTLANPVSGLGELTKIGGGTLLLTGVNVQAGGTRLKEGFLEVFDTQGLGSVLTLAGGTITLSGTQAITQPVRFVSASSVGVMAGGNAGLSGALSGSGDFTKTGPGQLLVSGSGAVSGRVVVQQGTLKVSLPETLSKVTTLVVGNAGADPATTRLDVSGLSRGLELGEAQTLKGRGVLLGKVGLNRARIAPGNSIDTIHVQGDLSLSNSDYEVEYTFANGGSSDRIDVTAGLGMAGKVTLNGGSVVLKAMSRSDYGAHRFTILTAAAGVDGQFLGIAPSAGVRARLLYGEPSIAAGAPILSIGLEIQRVSYESLGGSTSQREIGRGLDGVVVAPASAFGTLLSRMDSIATVSGIQAVLSELNPGVFGELYQLGLMRLEDVQKPISDRLNHVGLSSVSRGRFEVLSASVGGGSEWAAWTNGYAGFGNVESDAALGFAGLSRNEGGDVTGVERRIGPVTVGWIGATSFGGAHLSGADASVRSDSWHVGGYVSAPLAGGVFADASAIFGDVSNEVKRTQKLPTGTVQSRTTTHGSEWMLQTGVGMQLAGTASTWSLMPTVRLGYAGVRQSAIKEEGAGAFGIETGAGTSGTVLMKSGLEGAKEWRVRGRPIRLSGNLEWLHDFNVDPRRMTYRWQGAPGSEWGLSGASGKADGAKLGLALEMGLTDRKTLRLYGEREFLQKGAPVHLGFSVSVGF